MDELKSSKIIYSGFGERKTASVLNNSQYGHNFGLNTDKNTGCTPRKKKKILMHKGPGETASNLTFDPQAHGI